MPKNSPTQFTWVPARRSDETSATKRVRRILVVLTIAAIMGPLAFLVSLAKGGAEVDTSAIIPEGRAVADAAAYQFLTGQPVSVPVANTVNLDELQGSDRTVPLPYPASSITWDSFKLNEFTGTTELTAKFEVHTFLVVPTLPEASGARLEVDPEDTRAKEEAEVPQLEQSTLLVPQALEVPILLTQEGPRLAGAPSFSPWRGASAKQEGVADYSDFSVGETVDVPSQVTKQISVWAKAYAEDDRRALLTVTGDTDPNHVYMGLGGFTIPAEGSQVQILSATNAGPDTMLLRVRVRMQEATTSAAPAEGQTPHTAAQDFDVLVANPNNAQPSIQAWGAAGSAASMSPYSNAFTK